MQTIDDNQQVATLAALLHDVGKFAQRAGVPLEQGYRAFDRSDYGEHGAHALHSVQFIEKEVEARWHACRSPVLYHHNPSDPLAAIVAAADRFSAAERQSEGIRKNATLQGLRSVLPSVFSPDGGSPSYFALKRLDPADSDSLFPSPTPPSPTSQQQGYSDLWREFVTAHRQLGQKSFDTYCAGLYSLLQAYAWCIPSAAYGSVPDISLFDHSRTSAAIAAALNAYLADQGALTGFHDPSSIEREPCFRLAVGDLSGIQAYLYDIANVGVGGVARRLRARSLYLQLVTEVAAHQLLAELGLSFVSILMLSGGRFHLLLPNTERAAQAIAQAQEDADRWLLERFGGELAMNIASVDLTGADLKFGFGGVLESASVALSARKGNRLREALQADGAWHESAFVLPGFGGESACRSCWKLPRGPASDRCNSCETDSEIGRRLPDAAFLAFHAEERSEGFAVLGHTVEVVARGRQPTGKPYMLLGLDGLDVNTARLWPTLGRPTCSYIPTWRPEDIGARRHSDAEAPHPGDPVTFEALAERAPGRKLLGFLKADVDNLGETFVFGLKPGRDTSSRLAQMSRVLDLFFSGWLPNLLRSRFPDVYSVYAGGDDLLLVGPWDQAIELATTVTADFARLTGNPKMHLSAGVFIAKPGYPIARAADGAEGLLRAAKDAGRDRLSLLGHTLTWKEWATIRGVWRELRAEASDASTALLYHMLQYGRMWRAYREKGDALNLRFQPLLAYDISRNLDRRKAPGLYAFAEGLTTLKPGDATQRLILDNLSLLAQLWILGRGGEASD